jgi:hypothetical protein
MDSVIVLAPITGFTLMADRKNQDGIPVFLKTIEGYVPRAPSRYHQLSQFIFHGPADKWMTPQEFDGFLDQSNRLFGGGRIGLDQEVGQPFEIG